MSGADLITQDNDIDGNNIVGYYSGASGYQGFLATPVPEPSVPALLALGAAVFLDRRSRKHTEKVSPKS